MKQIEVTYTAADMFAVTAKAWRRSVSLAAILIATMVAVLVLLPVILDGVSLVNAIAWIPWHVCLGAAAFLLLFYLGACPLIGYLRLKRQRQLGPHRFTFVDEGVRVESPKGESLVYWPALKRVMADSNRLYLFVGPALAFVLPRRVFVDGNEFDAAVREAEARQSGTCQ